MSSNNTTGYQSGSSDSGNGSSVFQPIFISFLVLSTLFIALYLVRWYLRRSPVLVEKQNTGGLDTAAIAALPTFPYRKHDDNNNNNNSSKESNGSSLECPICISAVEEGEIVKLLPECMHLFHGDCVDLWLSGHSTCPVCRIEVLGSMSVIHHPSQVEVVPVPVPLLDILVL